MIRRSVRLPSSTGGPAALLAGLALAAGLSPAAASARQTVKFRLVIEGRATATRDFTVSGAEGLCEGSVTGGNFFQAATFLRGKGVTLEVTRRKVKGVFEYGVKRAGQKGSAFTVVTTVIRSAAGTEVWKLAYAGELLAKVSPSVTCEPLAPDLSATPGCNKNKTERHEIGLKVTGNSFSVASGSEPLSAP